jgi:sorting nexin-1/2
MMQSVLVILRQSLSHFGKEANLLGACEEDALGKAFSELGTKSEALSFTLQEEARL